MTAGLDEVLRKRSGPLLPLVAQPVGDVEAAMTAADRAARAWRLPQPELVRAAMNAVFAAGDDVVLRVGHASADPATVLRLAGRARANGVATPQPLRREPFDAGGGLWVTAWERVHPTGAPTDWERVGRMVAALHDLPPSTDATALPWCGDFPWWRFDEFAPPVMAGLDRPSQDGLATAMAAHAGWEEVARSAPLVVCHGDVHPGNVVTTVDGPVLLDWDLSCIGPRAWDHGALMTWSERWGGEPGVYEAFAAGYGRSMRGDPLGDALATLRLVASTLLRVRAGITDPGAAAEAEQRLRYWRGDPAAPQWTAQ